MTYFGYQYTLNSVKHLIATDIYPSKFCMKLGNFDKLLQKSAMDNRDQIRQRKQKMRNNLKQSFAKGGQFSKPLQHQPQSHHILEGNRPEKQHTEQLPHNIGRLRRKTSLDIRGMGDKFDMFECNQVFIYDDFDQIYDLLQKIDEGAQSVVYEAIEKKSQKKYAVKVTRKKDLDIIRSIKTQFRVLKNLDHPNIIKAYHLFIDQKIGISHLVLQYCESPNLRFHMLKNRIIKETEVAQILTGILHALVYLHSQGVCHRDIKPQNVLFDPKTRQIKLIDFEISKMIKYSNQKLQMLTNIGTLYYKAPEIYSSSCYNQQVDVWAVGVICYEMIMGDFPFKSKYESEVIRQIKQSQPKYDSNVTDMCINFIKKCLQKDPLKRFTALEALKSPFILKYSSVSSTNSSPMRRKNSQDHIRSAFGIEVSKCYDEDSGLKNTESLQIDSGIRVRASSSQAPLQ